MTLPIWGLALAGYRGIGPSIQKMAPAKRINLLIGPNNAGKSIFLEFLGRHLTATHRSASVDVWSRQYSKDEVHHGLSATSIRFGLACPADAILAHLENQKLRECAERLIEGAREGDLLWLTPNSQHRELEFMTRDGDPLTNITADRVFEGQVYSLWQHLTRQSGGSYSAHWLPESLRALARLATIATNYSVIFIPAIRQIGPTGDELNDHSGKGLIDRLAELQNPPHDEREKREVFDKINRFLRKVTGSNDAQIEIPFDRRHVLVSISGKVLPIEFLGTGIHEVIMIASFCSLHSDKIVCIEEPEIHLHPLLQKRLIAYLHDETTNQYFVATHSASLLDTAEASIFRVRNENGSTRISLAGSSSDRVDVCADLGIRASDLLQSNCVIWVEGPSDRIYLRHWISLSDKSLQEGIDYTIMFYGGRLLSHLDAESSFIGDFIALRRMNQNSFVIIDSDRRSAEDRINATKERVIASFGETRHWLTSGKEIENYLSERSVDAALKNIYGEKAERTTGYGQFQNHIEFSTDNGASTRRADKVRLAHAVTSQDVPLDVLDLQEKIESIVSFIHHANGTESA